MDCPYCSKFIPGMTGLQEAQNFRKHLVKCRKNPERQTIVNDVGKLQETKPNPDLLEAVRIRHESGQ
jgi:hypothetical protein